MSKFHRWALAIMEMSNFNFDLHGKKKCNFEKKERFFEKSDS